MYIIYYITLSVVFHVDLFMQHADSDSDSDILFNINM